MSHERKRVCSSAPEPRPFLSSGPVSQHLIELHSGTCHPPSFSYCPQGVLLTRRGNTWARLRFKWLTLRLRSPLGGGGGALHLVPWFPTDPPSREASVRSVPPETLETRHSSRSGLKGWQHTGRSSFSSHVSHRVYLRGPRQVWACPLGTVNAVSTGAASAAQAL